jgi:predicted ABC-type ATPase
LSPSEPGQPHFLIIAGPNGSGKSSAYQASIAKVEGREFRIINPDLFTSRLVTKNKSTSNPNLDAVERIEAWLETSILAGHTVGVETVLSTAKYRRLVTLAKEIGYRVLLIYVLLDDPLRNVERVAIRVKRGGHDVPRDKILSRYWRSLEHLPWFLDHADQAWICDNSGATPRSIGEKCDGVIRIDEKAIEAVVTAAQAASQMDD